jgi:alkaline phosphatase D
MRLTLASLALAHGEAPSVTTTTGLVTSTWMGVPTPDGVYVSSRLANDSTDVKLVISTDSDLSSPVLTTGAVSSTNKIARHTVTGLSANTTYYCGQKIDGVLDIGKIGKFKTAPTAGSQASFRFAAASCAQVGSNHAVYDAIRAVTPAFFIHMGDMHYADSTSTDEAVRQALYDDVLALSKPGQLFREVPTAYIYDDHDFCGNNSDSTTTGGTAAKAAFRARVPVPVASSAGNPNYYSFSYGRVRVIVTDLRAARSPVGNTDNSSKTMMGTTQKTWFKAELVAAVAANEVIVWVSSVPWLETTGNNDDGWADYNTERVELADYMKANGVAGRILISSGDMHAIAWGAVDYATSGGMYIPVFHSAPLDRTPSSKGGPYTAGPFQNNTQFGYFDVTDNGAAGVVFAYTGTNSAGGTVTTTSVTLGVLEAQVSIGDASALTGWNRTAAFTVSTPFANLNDNHASPTGWGFAITNAGSSVSATNGSTGAAGSFPFPDAVLLPQLVETGAGGDNLLAVKFTGLNNNKRYRVRAIPSRGSSAADRHCDLTVNGGSLQTIDAAFNVTTYAEWLAVAPSSGEITVQVARGAGNTTTIYLNALTIQQRDNI